MYTGEKVQASCLWRSLLALLIILIMASASQAQLANTKITFGSTRDGNYEIYTMNIDGTNLARLTNNSSSDNHPSWSPNGTKIAFTASRDDPTNEIYVMNADGTNQTRLTSSPETDALPSWSPDGTKIAFVSGRNGGQWEIYVMNADGTNQTRLTNNPGHDAHPSWSPDGTKIAFSKQSGNGGEIYVMNADGTNQPRLTNKPGEDNHSSWSPDGTKIFFTSDRDGNYEIYVMNADGTNPTRLTNNPGDDLWPSLSPDGTKIAFWSTRDGNDEIYVMNSDGTNQVNLTRNAASDVSPSWSKPLLPSSEKPDLVVASVDAPSTAQAGAEISVRFKWENQGRRRNNQGFKAEIRLSTDRTITQNDRLLLPSYNETALVEPGNGVIPTHRVTIPQDTQKGAYYVGVILDTENRIDESREDNNTGFDPEPINIEPIIVDDHGNTPANATQLATDGSRVSGKIERAGDVDYFKFNAIGSRKYVIETHGSMDAYIHLYSTNGTTELRQDDDSGDGSNSRIEWDCPANGTYFVKVRHYNAGQTGEYSFSVTGPPPSHPGPIVFVSLQINDDNVDESRGNGNGKAEPNEKIELLVTLKNEGDTATENVIGKLSATDKDVTITDDDVEYGRIDARSTDVDRDFDFTVADNATAHEVTFTLMVTAANGGPWTITFKVPVFARSGVIRKETANAVIFELPFIDDKAEADQVTSFMLGTLGSTAVEKILKQIASHLVSKLGGLFFDFLWEIPTVGIPTKFDIKFIEGENIVDSIDIDPDDGIVPLILLQTGDDWNPQAISIVIEKKAGISWTEIKTLTLVTKSEADVLLGPVSDYTILPKDPIRISESGQYRFRVTSKTTSITVHRPRWDVNEDGIVDIKDILIVAENFRQPNPKNPRADVNKDGVVDINDLILVDNHWGERVAAPPISSNGYVEMLEQWLIKARAANDGSETFRRGIAVLKQLLSEIVPQQTALLHNYPNPFNPDTWIPYYLSQDADVTIRIFNSAGQLVRILNLGRQAADIYIDKDKAAYWDGKDDLGQQVASGVYYYTIQAGNFSATRKMVIVK